MDKCIPLNTHERRRASASATVRIVDVLRTLLAAGVLALLVASSGHAGHARDRLSGDVQRVKMIGFTVADVEREAEFFTKVLQFEKVADFRVVGSEYGKMEGVFNANMRIVHLRLGDEIVELTQYVSPPTGRPIPVPSYSNDEWFEHMAIVASDMDAAYKILQENNVQQISAYPITIPQTNPGAAGIKAIKFHDPERHDLELLYFPPGKGDPTWQKNPFACVSNPCGSRPLMHALAPTRSLLARHLALIPLLNVALVFSNTCDPRIYAPSQTSLGRRGSPLANSGRRPPSLV
jgi:Glyoxalase/Bleomycin resistance protein/Dioxygenase superfamily